MTTQEDLEGEVRGATATEDGLEIVLKLHNHSDRAIHYIASPRVYNYDPATSRLVVHLSDIERPMLSQLANIEPVFRYVDPGADAELTLSLPEAFNVLSAPATPDERVGLQRLAISEATEIEVRLGWADTVYYEDPRPSDDPRASTVRWQQHELQLLYSRT